MNNEILRRNRRQQITAQLRRAQDRLARAETEQKSAEAEVKRLEVALVEFEADMSPRAGGPAGSAGNVFEEVASLFGLAPDEMKQLLSNDESRELLKSEAGGVGVRLKQHLAGAGQPEAS